jgi:hypothetical protein
VLGAIVGVGAEVGVGVGRAIVGEEVGVCEIFSSGGVDVGSDSDATASFFGSVEEEVLRARGFVIGMISVLSGEVKSSVTAKTGVTMAAKR